jgi:hypothetical protein
MAFSRSSPQNLPPSPFVFLVVLLVREIREGESKVESVGEWLSE